MREYSRWLEDEQEGRGTVGGELSIISVPLFEDGAYE